AVHLSPTGRFGLFRAWLSSGTRKAMEAHLLNQFLREYGSDRMASDLRLLKKWHESKGPAFETDFVQGIDRGDKDAENVERARRRVKHYYYRATQLHLSGLATARFMREICGLAGRGILLEVAGPLEQA